MKIFAGKTAVVTGAGSGIGRGLAHAFAEAGAGALALCDINAARLAETAAAAGKAGSKLFTRQLDVADRDAVHAFADDVERELGGADIVVNNAGVAQIARVEDLTYDDLEWVMGILFWGMVYGTKAFLPQLRRRPRSWLANISSVFGLYGVPTQSAYNAGKFAIRGFTEALRQEMKDEGLSVSCVYPGGIKTNIARDARLLQDQDTPEERARMAERFDEFAITTPEKAALTILRGMARNKARILIGRDALYMDAVQRLFPSNYHRILFRGANQDNILAPPAPRRAPEKDAAEKE